MRGLAFARKSNVITDLTAVEEQSTEPYQAFSGSEQRLSPQVPRAAGTTDGGVCFGELHAGIAQVERIGVGTIITKTISCMSASHYHISYTIL